MTGVVLRNIQPVSVKGMFILAACSAHTHAHLHKRLDTRLGIHQEVLIEAHACSVEYEDNRTATKLEVPELVAAPDVRSSIHTQHN